jgi:hypothetical protein
MRCCGRSWPKSEVSTAPDAENRQPNSEVVAEDTFGALFLRLAADSYRRSFESLAGDAITDYGEGACH